MAVIRCHYCPRFTNVDEAGARFSGWRLFRGLSITGKQLDDAICPSCSGRGPGADIPTWDIRCRHCRWQFTDFWRAEDPPLLTATEALKFSTRHAIDCLSSNFEFMDQDGTWYTRWDEEFRLLLNEPIR